MDAGDWITLAAILVALGIGIASILHTQSLQRKEHRERLLNEIIEWAEELDKASLTPDITLPPEDRTLENIALMQTQRELNMLMRCGRSLSRATSVEIIARTSFRKELLLDVLTVIDTTFKFTSLCHLKSLGALPSAKAISGKALGEIEKEVKESKESVDQLWEKYAAKLSDAIRTLLFNANVTKASLLK